ncbi:caspase-7 [Microplitis demolitor]|uniref:caspase-7 n=1 Tax=Microplitis demolitor TaxID=69319 RepID=UPI0006D4CCF6|nr:caspase-7 [Microplitis demolitor]
MIDYNDPKRNRTSAKCDNKKLFKLFQQFGFRVIEKTNITVNKLNKFLKKYSKYSLLNKVDSLFVVISAHGGSSNDENNNSVIEFTDGLIPCSEIINYFSVENCPTMAGKPKLFFFQTCRAREHNQNIDNPLKDLDINKLDNKYMKVNDKGERNFSDIFVVHSTLPNHISYRNKKYGSYFIQILCDVFQNYACRYSVQDLLLLIDAEMAKLRFGEYTNSQTITVKTIGVNKQLYLNPVVNNKLD